MTTETTTTPTTTTTTTTSDTDPEAQSRSRGRVTKFSFYSPSPTLELEEEEEEEGRQQNPQEEKEEEGRYELEEDEIEIDEEHCTLDHSEAMECPGDFDDVVLIDEHAVDGADAIAADFMERNATEANENDQQNDGEEVEVEVEVEAEMWKNQLETEQEEDRSFESDRVDFGRGSPGSTPYRCTAAEDLADDNDEDADGGPPCQPVCDDDDDERWTDRLTDVSLTLRPRPHFGTRGGHRDTDTDHHDNRHDNDIPSHPSVHFRDKTKKKPTSLYYSDAAISTTTAMIATTATATSSCPQEKTDCQETMQHPNHEEEHPHTHELKTKEHPSNPSPVSVSVIVDPPSDNDKVLVDNSCIEFQWHQNDETEPSQQQQKQQQQFRIQQPPTIDHDRHPPANRPPPPSSSSSSHSLLDKYGFVRPIDESTKSQRPVETESASITTADAAAASHDNHPNHEQQPQPEEVTIDHRSITPQQIRQHLTLDERKRIGTKVLAAKLRKGYLLRDIPDDDHCGHGTTTTTNALRTRICPECDMPKVSKRNGEAVTSCAVCPVLKKKVARKLMRMGERKVPILDDVEMARRSLFDESKSRSYYDRYHDDNSKAVVTEMTQSLSTLREWNESKKAVAYARDVLANQCDGNVENHPVSSKEKTKEEKCHEDTENGVTPRRLFHDDDDNNNDKLEDADIKETHDKTSSTAKVTLPPRPPRVIPSKTGKPPLLLLPRTVPSSSPRNASDHSTSSDARRTPPRHPHRRVSSSNSSVASTNTSTSSSLRSHRSRNSGNTTLASDARSIASTALLSLCDRIEATKRQMLKAEDVKEQMALAELLTQLSKAALAVKTLEKVAGDNV